MIMGRTIHVTTCRPHGDEAARCWLCNTSPGNELKFDGLCAACHQELDKALDEGYHKVVAEKAMAERAAAEAPAEKRELSFIVPDRVISYDTLRQIAEIAGGYSVTPGGQGGWIDGDGKLVVDSVETLVVAVDGEAMADAIVNLVLRDALVGDQDALYVKWIDGTVEIIDVVEGLGGEL